MGLGKWGIGKVARENEARKQEQRATVVVTPMTVLHLNLAVEINGIVERVLDGLGLGKGRS